MVSIRGCKVHANKPIQTEEKKKFLEKDAEKINNAKSNSALKQKKNKGFIKLEVDRTRIPDEKLGYLENLLQIIYQVSP